MEALEIKQQKSSDKKWINEAGDVIPYDRVTASERLHERKLSPLAKERIALRHAAEKHKQKCFEIARELYGAFLAENGGVNNRSKGKGNVTRFNFDRSIKIEINVNEAIVFDEDTLQLAKDKLDALLTDGLMEAKDWIKPIVMAAFSTASGGLDTKEVLGLRRHSNSIPAAYKKQWDDAMGLIDKSIRKPKSKEYFSLYVRDENGKYVDVHLNFSNI